MADYYLSLILFFLFLGVLVWSIQLYLSYKKRRMLKEIDRMPFPETYRKILNKIPHYRSLSPMDREKMERSILRFVHLKHFLGVKMEVTDEMKVVTAFYACLLLLHIETENCYDNLKRVIFYPSPVIIDSVRNNGGIFTKEDFVIDGQSANDTVVLVWHDARKEAYHLRHDNVIIHEFAHEIDYMDGEVDGVPPLEKSRYHEWTQVLYRDFKKLNDTLINERDWGKYKLLGSYAATNEAEFFAVVTERFFESPHSLKRHFPELYAQLKHFYKVDPVEWVKA
jgi:Mlc titration factor MtfA (ptsG expression regulator)